MMRIGNDISATDYSIAFSGNDNIVNQYISPVRQPKRAFIYDICKIIVEKNFDGSVEYSISDNVNWSLKIEYNEIVKYKMLFDEYSFAREDIEGLLDGYESRTILIRSFKRLYVDSVCDFPDKSNDDRLDWIFKELCKAVDEASDPMASMYIEERDQAILQLMFYAFTKCQILEKPPKKG
ncbi:hypothetical protein [Carnobacterium sp.]|uniref:hypothetical protein n=1 Tax=Carnobacterium sp. TaxID=48221 RepID=UPI00388D9F7C